MAAARGRRRLDRREAEQLLAPAVGFDVALPEAAVVTNGPEVCPACGSTEVAWAVLAAEERLRGCGRGDIHPVAWHETEWLADSFVCRACDAGWIEPDGPQPIRWVRPYWVIHQ
jgi:hypothetical protein